MNKRLTILLFVVIFAALSLAGCSGLRSGPATPTITAIPLPTEASRAGRQPGAPPAPAGATATPSPFAPGSRRGAASPSAIPTEIVVPTETPSPSPAATRAQPTATAAQPTATATAAPSATPLPPTATPTDEPEKPTPRPTPTPRYTGRLVFQTALGGELYVVNADGSGLRRLTDGIDPIWSPDGKQVAFTRYRDPRGVWVINADGSGARLVFAWNQARWPSWSPDGSQILFTRLHGGQGERTRCFFGQCFTIPANPHWRLGVVNVSNGSFSEPPSPLLSLSPDWAPNGDHLVYAGNQGLVIQNLDGSNVYNITNDGDDIDPVWSPDGQRIVYTHRQHDHWELYAVDASGANPVRLTNTPNHPDGTPASSVAAAWSPDGKYIAFYTDRAASTTAGASTTAAASTTAGGKWEIWVMKADGSDAQRMFATALNGLTLGHSFDGDRALSWTR